LVYRQPINISNTAGDLTNYQVRIDLNSTNVGSNFDWSNNGSDIRFTNSTDDLLNFWIESWDSTGQEATIWVNVTSLPNNTNTTVYMYYGNSEASSVSNGDATFILFDDFEDDAEDQQPSGWTTAGSSSTWQVKTRHTRREKWIISGGKQGITTDGTYLYLAGGTTVYKYTKDGSLVSSNDLADQVTLGHFGDLCYKDGYLYIADCNYPDTPADNYIVKVDPSDLSFVAEYHITDLDAHDSGIAWDGTHFWISTYRESGYDRAYKYNENFQYQNEYQELSHHFCQGIEFDSDGNIYTTEAHHGGGVNNYKLHKYDSSWNELWNEQAPWADQGLCIEGDTYWAASDVVKTTSPSTRVTKCKIEDHKVLHSDAGTTTGANRWIFKDSPSDLSPPIVIEGVVILMDYDENAAPDLCWAGDTGEPHSYSVDFNKGTGTQTILRRIYGTTGYTTIASADGESLHGERLRTVVKWKSDGNMDIKVYKADGTQYFSMNGTDTTYTSGRCGFRLWRTFADFDTTMEPTHQL